MRTTLRRYGFAQKEPANLVREADGSIKPGGVSPRYTGKQKFIAREGDSAFIGGCSVARHGLLDHLALVDLGLKPPGFMLPSASRTFDLLFVQSQDTTGK